MRLLLALTASLAAVIAAFAQEPERAREGRGLLPKATETPATVGITPPPYAFQPDPSGAFSRIIFETNEHPDFKLVIRDFSFPPDRRPRTITLPSAAFLHLLGGPGEIKIAKQRLKLTPLARTAVPSGAPIDVANGGEQHVVVRALILEPK
jgi:hypothetical protein